MSAKAWARSHPVGQMVGHPSVIAEARQPHGVSPQLVRRGDLSLVAYARTRVYVDRDAWEMLPAGGVLVMQVRDRDGVVEESYAFTADELTAVFGEVRVTRIWEQVRCYHFPKAPPAVTSFRVAPASGDR
jgi:hypothetical protein